MLKYGVMLTKYNHLGFLNEFTNNEKDMYRCNYDIVDETRSPTVNAVNVNLT